LVRPDPKEAPTVAAALPDPIPADITEPEPGDNAWADALADYAAELAAEAAMDADTVATALVLTPSEFAEAPHQAARRAVGWSIDGPRTAEWAMAKVAAARRAEAELAAQRDEWMLRIRHWFDQAASRHQASAAFFAGHLERYALAERERTDGKVKTVPLPSGKVSTTASSAKAVVLNEDAVVAWADAVLADEPDVLELVAPHSRRVLVSGLRQLVQLEVVVDEARLLLHDGQLVEWMRTEVGQRCPGPGDYWPPLADEPEHHDDNGALVAQVEVVLSHLEVRGPDGLPVPGTGVEPATVTAKVNPS
jgi:hypothetical protein